MKLIFSAIFTLLFAGIFTGGVLISRRVDPHQTIFMIVGLAFFLFCFIGMYIGSKLHHILNPSTISIFFGIYCLGMTGYFIFKYDQAYGFMKEERNTFFILLSLFLFIGVELALLKLTLWIVLLWTIIFSCGVIFGAIVVFRIIHTQRISQLFAFIPLLPLLFIGLFKLL